MGDPGSEGKESNSDANMDVVYHKGVPRLTLSCNSNATNEPNRLPAWQVVHSEKNAQDLALMTAMVSRLKLFKQISTRPKPNKLIKQQAISTEG